MSPDIRRRISDRSGRAGWTELLLGLGAIFLILAVVTFALLLLEPVVNHPGAWDPWLAVLGGALGLLLIFAGIAHRRRTR